MEKNRKRVLCYVLVLSLVVSGVLGSNRISFATGEEPTDPAVTEAQTTEGTTEKKAKKTTEKKKKEKKTTEKSTEKKKEETETPEPENPENDETLPDPNNGITDASVSKAKEDAEEAAKNKREAQEVLKKLRETKSSIQDYITELDKELNQIEIEISHLEKNQKELQTSIKDTRERLKEAEGAQKKQYEDMLVRIQMVYESGNKRYLDVLMTATSMTDILNKTEYISQVSVYDYNVLKKLKDAKEQVANIKLKLERDLAANAAMKEVVTEQKEARQLLIEEKSNQVKLYEASIEGQEEEVAKYAQAEAEAEAIIAAAEAAASNSATSVYTGGEFTWPVPSSYQISSYFGNRDAPTAGASTYHKGIDIACETGADIVAAADGTVIVSTYNYAEGNYICIDHGGGVVTVYMHNSQLLVSVGETVHAGQVIAAAGSTGFSTGPHCHFGVRVDGTYVDPLGYLQ